MKHTYLGRVLLIEALLCASGCAGMQRDGTDACPAVSSPRVASFGDSKSSTDRAPSSSQGPDPIVTDGDKYHLVLENAEVRVLSYHDKPGDKTHPHHHNKFVLYALSPFRRRLIFPDGTVKERDFKTGDVIWMPEQIHTGENIGTTDTNVVIVEFAPMSAQAHERAALGPGERDTGD